MGRNLRKTLFGYRKNDEIEINVYIERNGVESDVWVMPYEAQSFFENEGSLKGLRVHGNAIHTGDGAYSRSLIWARSCLAVMFVVNDD